MTRRNQARAAIVVVALILASIPISSIVTILHERGERAVACDRAGGILVRTPGNLRTACIDRSVVIHP